MSHRTIKAEQAESSLRVKEESTEFPPAAPIGHGYRLNPLPQTISHLAEARRKLALRAQTKGVSLPLPRPPITFLPLEQTLPFDLSSLNYITEANLIPLMYLGAERVLGDNEFVGIHLQVTWGGYIPMLDNLITARGLTRAALAIKVAKSFRKFINCKLYEKHSGPIDGVSRMKPWIADWDIVNKLRLKSIHNVYSHHWMAVIVMAEAD